MTSFIPISSISAGVAASAAGSFATGSGERAAKTESANHSLNTRPQQLTTHSLERDANTSADRDADGWTGSQEDDERRGPASPETLPPTENLHRPRLPDEPGGSLLDVII